MRRASLVVVVASLMLGADGGAGLSAQLQDAPIRHDSGQSITPSFEGWFKNPDGTLSLSFGYLNRNYKQELDIPVGPNNKIEPGAVDQGQPTYFLPRRQTGVFTVVVPKDAPPTTKITWTITANGQTVSVPGHLRPEWEIDALKDLTNGNTPPVIKFDPAGSSGQGQHGTRTEMTVAVGKPAILNVWVTDDLVRKRPDSDGGSSGRGGDRGPQLGVTWSKYRGTGKVAFSNSSPKIEAGKATTTATFSEPGVYILRALAWDDTGPQAAVMAVGFFCCWTNGYVKVNVSPANRGQ